MSKPSPSVVDPESFKTCRTGDGECLEEAQTGQDDARCRNEECDGDTNDGEGWNGFCGNCADRLHNKDDN